MTFLDKTIYFAARGVHLYPNFLDTVPQLKMISKTLELFRSIYPPQQEEENELDYELRPYAYNKAKVKFRCIAWQTNDHKHVNFRGNSNIPPYVQDLFLPRLFSLLALPHNDQMEKRWSRLNKSRWNLDINLNYTNEKNKTESNLKDYTCGSLRSSQTALLVYNVGAPALFRLTKDLKEGFTESTLLVPHNSLLVVEKKALEPGQHYLLPIFRDYVTQNEEFSDGELRRAMFSFKYTLPIPIRDPETPGKPPALA